MSEISTDSSTHRFQVASSGERGEPGSTESLWCEFTVDSEGRTVLALSHGPFQMGGREVVVSLDQLDQLQGKLCSLPRGVA